MIENVATITAVDPSTINYNYAVTIGDSAPSAASFKQILLLRLVDRQTHISVLQMKMEMMYLIIQFILY